MFLSLAFHPRCKRPSNPNYTPLRSRERPGSFRSFVRSISVRRSLSSETGYFIDDLRRRGNVSRAASLGGKVGGWTSFDRQLPQSRFSTSCVGEIPRRVTLVRFCFLFRLLRWKTQPPILWERRCRCPGAICSTSKKVLAAREPR